MEKSIFCPQCKKPTTYSPENQFRPFCSDRCQLLDLGDWANEKFAIPAEDASDAISAGDSEDSNDESDDHNGTLRH